MGYMSAVAKVLNKQPKTNSKSHKEKEAKRLAMMSKKIICEKCGKNTTLYNKQGHYYCKECKQKGNKKNGRFIATNNAKSIRNK